MDTLQERIAALEARVCALSVQKQATEQRLCRAERRLRGTWTLALVSAVGAFAFGANPEARAQFGVTLAGLNIRLTAVEAKTAPLSVSGNNFVITGKNVFIQDGTGGTDSDSGLGNLTVGYNEPRNSLGDPDVRTGSHNLIVGSQNNYSRFGGLVAGNFNTISGEYASVSGGTLNSARGDFASVSGGNANTADGGSSSVSGGGGNSASGERASVSGGSANRASGDRSSVSGGFLNSAGGQYSSVSGGAQRIIGDTPAEAFDWRAGGLLEDN